MAVPEFDTSLIPHYTEREKLQVQLDGSRTIRTDVPQSCEKDSTAAMPIDIFVKPPDQDTYPLVTWPCSCCGETICAKVNLERQTPEGMILEVAWSHPIPGERFLDGTPMYAGALYPVQKDLA